MTNQKFEEQYRRRLQRVLGLLVNIVSEDLRSGDCTLDQAQAISHDINDLVDDTITLFSQRNTESKLALRTPHLAREVKALRAERVVLKQTIAGLRERAGRLKAKVKEFEHREGLHHDTIIEQDAVIFDLEQKLAEYERGDEGTSPDSAEVLELSPSPEQPAGSNFFDLVMKNIQNAQGIDTATGAGLENLPYQLAGQNAVSEKELAARAVQEAPGAQAVDFKANPAIVYARGLKNDFVARLLGLERVS